MEKSESISNLAVALIGFHKSVGKIKKENTNPFFKSKYADLSTILDVVNCPLNENGLSIIQLPKGVNELQTMLIHSSGEYIAETYTMTPVKNDPQGLGSSITYQRRYALGAILSLNIDIDDDGNGASGNKVKDEPKIEPKQPVKVEPVGIIEMTKAVDEMNNCKSTEQVNVVWAKYPNCQTKDSLFYNKCIEVQNIIKNAK